MTKIIKIKNSNFKKFVRDFKEALGYLIENSLIDRCPVDTGALKGSISVEQKGRDYVINMLYYWKYLEFGTYKQRPQPFVRPVLRSELGKLIKEALEVASSD